MTAIEAYLIFAPLTLAALAWGFALWTIRH
jgi:hypothetical protein